MFAYYCITAVLRSLDIRPFLRYTIACPHDKIKANRPRFIRRGSLMFSKQQGFVYKQLLIKSESAEATN